MPSENQTLPATESGSAIHGRDKLRLISNAIHFSILVYVIIGWSVPSRPFLFAYLLVLPSIMLQWLFNGGASIVSSFENLSRTGVWRDKGDALQGAFLQTLLREAGLVVPNIVLTTIACTWMFVFWIQAIWRMVLIVPEPP